MPKRLEGKIAIVTGAGSIGPGWGNGRATAVLFAREGASVVLVDKVRGAAEDTAQAIAAERGICEVAELDVTDAVAFAAMVERTQRRFGRIDILHNNVGRAISGGVEELSVEDFRWQIDINLTSIFIGCKAVLPIMRAQGGGVITNVGSVGGHRHLGHDFIGYSAAKAAVVQFTRQLAVHYGPHGVRCNTIVPGLIDAPLLEHHVVKQKGRLDLAGLRAEAKTRVPLGRRGDAWDIAHAALYLASDEAKYVTGTEILVDGGLLARSA